MKKIYIYYKKYLVQYNNSVKMSFNTFYNTGYVPLENEMLANGAGKRKRNKKMKEEKIEVVMEGSGLEAPVANYSNLGIANTLATIVEQLGPIVRYYTGGAVSGGALSGGEVMKTLNQPEVMGGKKSKKMMKKEQSESDEEDGGASSGGRMKKGSGVATGGAKASLLKKVMAYKWKNGCSLKEAWAHFKKN